MKKNKLYFLLILVASIMLSCSSSDPAVYEVEGKWKVITREFVCEGDKALEARVNKLYEGYLKKGKEYIRFEKQGESGFYEEGYILPDDVGDIDVERYTGSYTKPNTSEVLDVSIKNIGAIWNYSLKIKDMNMSFMYLKQEMNSEDISRLMLVYFQASGETVKEGITASWATKLEKDRTGQ